MSTCLLELRILILSPVKTTGKRRGSGSVFFSNSSYVHKELFISLSTDNDYIGC